MAQDLNLPTVELTSTLRTAPLNGSPSSSDYNSSQRENLVDLAAITGFINNTLLPLVNALPAGALLPIQSPVGIEGRTVWTDTSDQSVLFFDSLSSTPLSIADSLRALNGIVTVMNQQLTDQGVEVASLQARLASTNQNDIALALQNLSSALNQVTVNQQIQNVQITEIQGTKAITVRSDQSGQSGAVLVPAGSTAHTTLTFPSSPPAFNDNFYTAIVSVEVQGGYNALVNVGGFQKNGTGASVTVSLANFDVVDHTVIVHVFAQHD